MTRKLASPCAEPLCPALAVRHGRCGRHQRRDVRPTVGLRPGYGPRWQALRLQVLREEPYCRRCGRPSTRVDHVVPLRRGGTNIRYNLQGLCERCHNSKTSRQGGRWI